MKIENWKKVDLKSLGDIEVEYKRESENHTVLVKAIWFNDEDEQLIIDGASNDYSLAAYVIDEVDNSEQTELLEAVYEYQRSGNTNLIEILTILINK